MEIPPAQAKETLTLHGISPSRPRIAILTYLQEHSCHPTADEIYHALRSSIPTLSPATVYNTLRLFADKKLCVSLTINEKRVCFDGETLLHGHFFCTQCETIYDIPLDQVPDNRAPMECGHKINEAHYYYKGVCARCLASDRSDNNDKDKQQ